MPDTKYLSSQQMTINGLVMELDNRGRCEIRDLKEIGVFGELKLKKLQTIKNPKNAGEADLKRKSSLRKLELLWDNGESDNVGVYDGVIEALQPPPNLKELLIDNYPGSQFPTSWWLDLDSLHLQKLAKSRVYGCRRCENLPPLKQLPHLDSLFLGLMPSVKFLVRRTYEENVSLFPALRRIELHRMTGLEAWMATGNEETSNSSNGGGVKMFTNLEELEVEDCESLMAAASCSSMMTSLQTLRVTHYDQLVSLCQRDIELDILHIETCLKDGTPALPHLFARHLRIEGCENLTALPVSFLGNFDSLSTLTIAGCPNLTTLPDGLRYDLEALYISQCSKLDKKKCEEGGEFWRLISHIPAIYIS